MNGVRQKFTRGVSTGTLLVGREGKDYWLVDWWYREQGISSAG